MKKFVQMLPTLIVVLLLLTAGSFAYMSGTLAKYVVNATAADTARVAQWGVVLAVTPDVTDSKMFHLKYKNDLPQVTASSSLEVDSADTDALVAPGTHHGMTFTILGSPEVATRIDFDFSGSSLTDWTLADGSAYEPIVWTITESINGATATTVLNQGTMTAMIAYFAGISATEYAPNSTLNRAYYVKWEWPFEVSAENNLKDTYLAKEKDPLPTITFAFSVAVTQINDYTA